VAKRYEQLFPLVDKIKPAKIVEVGVHTALRGSAMCRKALEHRAAVEYVGYDVFDMASMEFQEAALNGKGAPSESRARSRLQGIRGLSYSFVVGDTRETLGGKTVDADFAFIDGDHRVEAIRIDYAALFDCPCVVFDDYYRAGPDGKCPDLTKYGANAVVDELAAAGRRVEILPAADVCKHGGFSHLAVVWK
jgi:hypothetical protein